MSLTTKVLIGLIAGLALGILVAASGNPQFVLLTSWLEPLGTLWINAIRMTVIPLVVSAILVGVTSLPDLRSMGRIGGRAVLLFLVMLALASTFAVVIAPPLFAALPIDPTAVEALRASAGATPGEAIQTAESVVSARKWLVDLIPTNPIKAAADGAMLPLIMFTVAFGLALSRVTGAARESFLNSVQAVLDASLTLVRWVIAVAPLGVFALSVPLATRLGLAAAGAVIYYVLIVSALCTAFMALLYLIAWIAGGVPIRTFARATMPAQAVAFSSRSSLVSLPPMLEGSETILRLPVEIRSFLLPLAVATFRTGGAIGIPVGVLFLARLYGIDLGAAQLATIAVMSVLTTFTVPGIPNGSILVMVPVLTAAGLPAAGIGLLFGVDTIPDMFRTATNVTGDMSAAVLLSRGERIATPSEPAFATLQQ